MGFISSRMERFMGKLQTNYMLLYYSESQKKIGKEKMLREFHSFKMIRSRESARGREGPIECMHRVSSCSLELIHYLAPMTLSASSPYYLMCVCVSVPPIVSLSLTVSRSFSLSTLLLKPLPPSSIESHIGLKTNPYSTPQVC